MLRLFTHITFAILVASNFAFAGTICSTDNASEQFIKAEISNNKILFSLCSFEDEELKKPALYRKADGSKNCHYIESKLLSQQEHEEQAIELRRSIHLIKKTAYASLMRGNGVMLANYGRLLRILIFWPIQGAGMWQLYKLNSNEPEVDKLSIKLFRSVSHSLGETQSAKQCQNIDMSVDQMTYIIQNLSLISDDAYTAE